MFLTWCFEGEMICLAWCFEKNLMFLTNFSKENLTFITCFRNADLRKIEGFRLMFWHKNDIFNIKLKLILFLWIMFLLSFDFLLLSAQDIVMFLGDVLENVMFWKNVTFYVRFYLRKRDVFTWFWVGKCNVFSLKKESYLHNVLMFLKWYFEENVMFLKWYLEKNAILMWYFDKKMRSVYR